MPRSNRQYTVSRALVLRVRDSDTLAASTSISRAPRQIEIDGMPVLLAFASPRTVNEAFTQVSRNYEVDRSAFEDLVAHLVELEVIVPAGEQDASENPADLGFASHKAHFHMLRDTYRVLAYKAAIAASCSGAVVAEIGCGTGILSALAMQAGARKVYAIEEAAIADIAEEVLGSESKRLATCEPPVVIRGNSRDITLPERADVIIHEILGSDPIRENVLPVIDDARARHLAPGGLLLPGLLDVCCVAYAAPSSWLDSATAAAYATELGRIYGVDLEPFGRALRSSQREFLCPGPREIAADRILTDEARLFRFEFDRPLSDQRREPVEVPLACIRAGKAGGVLVYFRARLGKHGELNNAPLTPRTHWGWSWHPFHEPRTCESGDTLAVNARIDEGLRFDRIVVSLRDS